MKIEKKLVVLSAVVIMPFFIEATSLRRKISHKQNKDTGNDSQ